MKKIEIDQFFGIDELNKWLGDDYDDLIEIISISNDHNMFTLFYRKK